MPESNPPDAPPPEVPEEFAEAYREAYRKALADATAASATVGQHRTTPLGATPGRWRTPALIALVVVVLILAAYLLGRLT